MLHFKDFCCVGSTGPDSGSPGSHFLSSLFQNTAKTLLTIAVFCIGLGVLVLIFPLILAFFVAAILFFISLVSLVFAWKVYRSGRIDHDGRRRIHVTVRPAGDEQ